MKREKENNRSIMTLKKMAMATAISSMALTLTGVQASVSVQRSSDHCLLSPFSSGNQTPTGPRSSEWGGVKLTRVTSVLVNPGGNTIVIEGQDGTFGSKDGWGQYRAGKKVIVEFQFYPNAPSGFTLNPAARAGAIECLNNARIAMANGMNLSINGNMVFSQADPQNSASACKLVAKQADTWNAGFTNDIGDCTLSIADPALKSLPLQP